MRIFNPFTGKAPQAFTESLVTFEGNHQGDICPGKKAREVSGGDTHLRESRAASEVHCLMMSLACCIPDGSQQASSENWSFQ